MKTNIWKVLFIISLPFSIIFLVLSVFALRNDSSDWPKKITEQSQKKFQLSKHLLGLDSNNVYKNFPYDMYLDSGDIFNINSIRKDLVLIDTSIKSSDKSLSIFLLSTALTNNLQEKLSPEFINFNPDRMIQLLRWAEKFDAYSEIDTNNFIFYNSIFISWTSFLQNKMTDYVKENNNIKYNSKFRYINDNLNFCGSIHKPQNSKSEKAIVYFFNSKWSYLFDRFWNATSVTFKLLFLLPLLITLYGYYCIITKHLIKK